MPFAGLLALVSIMARAPEPPPPSAVHSPLATLAIEQSVGDGREIPRCPEGLRLEGSNRTLIEVPETATRLADKTGSVPGWVPPPEAWPVPCVSPARR
jgi:hypothetical protein